MDHRVDVAVVGGGLAGLSAGLRLARGGRRVAVFEKSSDLGGRARTQVRDGFRLNLGPHAVYLGGAGRKALTELGIRLAGGEPVGPGSLAYRDGDLSLLPANLSTLLRTTLLSAGAKWELARFLARLPLLSLDELAGVSVKAWLGDTFARQENRDLLAAILRIATYANDPERQSAGAALAQLRVAQRAGVRYLDGGWQTIVAALSTAALAEGVVLHSSAPVAAVDGQHRVEGVRLADGSFCRADAVVLATDPGSVAALVGDRAASLARFSREAVPVRVASLELGLRRLTRPSHLVALGIDRPFYFSVHSAVARLAPEGLALAHVAQYLGAATPADAGATRAALEAFADRVQPGWKDEAVLQRFLPDLRVSHHVVTASGGGMAGRPSPAVSEMAGLYVAGDWVGAEGLLADAALASARAAAKAILEAAPVASVA